MRKIFAYVLTVVTLVAMMVFFIPNIKENTKFAMEYTGGFEVLYEVKSSMKDIKDNTVAQTISDGMNKILDINGISNSIITVEDGNYIRVNVTSNNQLISDEIRNLIQNNESYEISFRDASDNLLATGKEILKVEGATYSGELNYYGQPIIYLNIKDTDLLYEITNTVSQASDTHLVIWVGFEDGVDSYANIETDSSTAKKVIYNATVSEALDDEIITVTGDYTEEAAKNTVNLVNSGTYEYDDLEKSIVHLKNEKEDEAIKNKTMMFIALGVCLTLILVAISVLFKLEGVYSIPTVIVNEFLMILFFNKISAVINPQVLAGFILANVVMFGLLFILLNKYKTVLTNSKSAIKAYKETYKKNTSVILDTLVTIILLSVVSYFLGNNAEQFSIMLATSSVATMICLLLLQRLTMYLTCDFFNKNTKAVIVSLNTAKEEVVTEENVNTKKEIDDYAKPAFFGFIGLISLGLIVILVATFAFKTPFTLFGEAKNMASIEIITNQEYFKNEAEVKEFFDKEDYSIELDKIEFNKEDNKYVVKITSDESFAKYESLIKDDLKELCGENTDFVENYVVYVNDYNATSILISFKSALYTSGLSLLLIALYFALRYKYSYSLATITTTLMTIASLIAVLGITRIPLNSSSVIAITIISIYSLFMLVPFFTRIKEYMKESKKPYLSYKERVDCFKRGRTSIILPIMITTIVFDVISLIAMFFDLSNFSMYLAFIIGSVLAFIYNMIFVPRIWILFENKRDKRKKTFKNKNISKSKYRTLDEQVFIGVND